MMHEFEALLFSDCAAFGRGIGRPDLGGDFQEIRDAFENPEEIDDSPQTAPSKRVERLVRGYEKPLLGTLAALEIGLATMRRECPHFGSCGSQRAGRQDPKRTFLPAQALNVSMDYLVGWVDEPRPTSEIATHLWRKTALLVDLKWDEEEHLEVDTEDFVGVNEIIASAGTGDNGINERITNRVKFRRPWMRKHGLKGRLCRIMKVAGEGMEPTLPDGVSILVNLEQQEPRDGRLFVVRIADAIVVKRLIRNAEAGWLLHSDNPNRKAWPTQPWPAEATIVGEVKWLGRTFT